MKHRSINKSIRKTWNVATCHQTFSCRSQHLIAHIFGQVTQIATMSRLVELGRRKFISVSALADVLKDIKENGMPTHVSRSSIKRARDHEFEQYNTPYGAVLKSMNIGTDENGDPCCFWFADSRACLYYMISESPKLAQFIREKLAAHPCNIEKPWHIVVYNDEISPGDQLQHHNPRKTQAFYYSFLEFGADALSSEFLWFTLSAARSDDVSEIEGLSFGTFAKEQMRSFEQWSTVGFQCGAIMIWARVKLLVADESAIKYTLDVKGASGNLPCFKCRNILSKKAFAKSRPSSGMLSITELDFEKFDRHDDNTLKANALHLAAQKPILRKGEFEKLETALGLNFNPSGVLLSELDFLPFTGTCYDPQHVYLVNGIFNSEVGQLLVVLKKVRSRYQTLHRFFQSFDWPANAKSGKKIIDNRSTKSVTDSDKSKHPTLSCPASDALGAYGLLQEFLMLRVLSMAMDENKRAVVAACASFFALCTVITMATMIPRGGISPSMLMEAIVKHLSLHTEAYGNLHWVPKFHYSLHLPEQLAIWGMLIFCFAHKRKHKEVKRYLQGRQNTSATYDKNVLHDVLHIQKMALSEDFPYPRGTQLLHPRPASKKTVQFLQENFPDSTDFFTSVDAKAGNFVTCHIDDVIYLKWDDQMAIGQIKILCSADGECVACVTIWTRLPHRNMYNMRGDDYFILLTDIVDTCVYRISGDVAYVVPPRGAVHAELLEKT